MAVRQPRVDHEALQSSPTRRSSDLKDPANGGAQKITPDVRGKGKTIINEMRVDTEVIINEHLEKYAPTKIVKIKGIDVEVPNSRSEEHTSELQSRENLVCRLLLEKK